MVNGSIKKYEEYVLKVSILSEHVFFRTFPDTVLSSAYSQASFRSRCFPVDTILYWHVA